MEIAIIAGVAIVAIIAMVNGMGSPASGPVVSAGNTGGPSVQMLQEQAGSTAGQSGSGSMNPTGMLPPVATNKPVSLLPSRPGTVPINVYPAPRPFRPIEPIARPTAPKVTFGSSPTGNRAGY